ncbi:MAG: cytidylate kinase-like family protein [Acidobacteria bacterium]|nr:cytidylate kinase-like family protein [Acidobacteriota bacterium]
MTKSQDSLLPSVERRLSAWISVKDKRKDAEAPPPGATITISRKYGCEAFPLALRLKELLDAACEEPWIIYDKALLERVSQAEHLSMEFLEDLGSSRRADDSLGFVFPGHVTHDEAFRRLAWHLVQIAGAGNAIIVGRGGAILTRHLKNCYHFRLDASDAFCVSSTAQRLKISEKEAAEMLREYHQKRDAFIESYLRASVRDLTHYHAVYNRDRSGLEEIAAGIVSFVERSWGDKTCFKAGTLAAVAT